MIIHPLLLSALQKGAVRYRQKLNHRFDRTNTKAAGAEPMSKNWEMVWNLIHLK